MLDADCICCVCLSVSALGFLKNELCIVDGRTHLVAGGFEQFHWQKDRQKICTLPTTGLGRVSERYELRIMQLFLCQCGPVKHTSIHPI